jgi:hypothetical protein
MVALCPSVNRQFSMSSPIEPIDKLRAKIG